jgi:hypothetical protein
MSLPISYVIILIRPTIGESDLMRILRTPWRLVAISGTPSFWTLPLVILHNNSNLESIPFRFQQTFLLYAVSSHDRAQMHVQTRIHTPEIAVQHFLSGTLHS